MKTVLKLAPLVLAMLAAVALPAAARDHDTGHDRGRQESSHNRRGDDRRDGRGDRGRHDERRGDNRYAHDGRRDDRRYHAAPVYRSPPRYYARPVYRSARYYPPRGHYGPPSWARGRDYRSYGYNNVYYVPYNDYGRYGLYSPGYGHRWVRDDRGNFLLVAAATGIITSLLLNHAY